MRLSPPWPRLAWRPDNQRSATEITSTNWRLRESKACLPEKSRRSGWGSPGTCGQSGESRLLYGGRREAVESRELLQGQKLLGWVLILIGLLMLIAVGIAQGLVARYSIPSLECFASWAPGAWWNRTCVGIVAWLLLAAGYVFLLSALLQEHLQRMEKQMAERLDRLTREVAHLKRGQHERAPASRLAPTPSLENGAGSPVAVP